MSAHDTPRIFDSLCTLAGGASGRQRGAIGKLDPGGRQTNGTGSSLVEYVGNREGAYLSSCGTGD